MYHTMNVTNSVDLTNETATLLRSSIT